MLKHVVTEHPLFIWFEGSRFEFFPLVYGISESTHKSTNTKLNNYYDY